MKLSKMITGSFLAGTLLLGGTSIAFAANHTYEPGSAEVAIAARDKAVNAVFKDDRPKVTIEENKKLKPVLEGYLNELNADIADLEKAIETSEKYIADKTAENKKNLEVKSAELAKLENDWKISVDAHGEDLAKYFYPDTLKQIETLKAEIAALGNTADIAVAEQAIKDNRKKLEALENDRFIVKKELRNFRLNPCASLGECLADLPAAEQPAPEVKPAEAKPAAEQPAPEVKSAEKAAEKAPVAELASDSAKKTEGSLASTGAGAAVLFGTATVLSVAGVSLRRKFAL